MRSLSEFLSRFHLGQTAFLGLTATALILVLFCVGMRQRRVRRRVIAANASASNPDNLFLVDNWLPRASDPGERRNSLRRIGRPVPVRVIDPKRPQRKIKGLVVDRSMTGLCVALPLSLPIGSPLQICAENAHPDAPWVQIIVRNCTQGDNCFEHGCQFEGEPPLFQILSFS
jgi:hypothetical protein